MKRIIEFVRDDSYDLYWFDDETNEREFIKTVTKMEKYYTPEIEEFYVGFEFEVEDLSDDLKSKTWRCDYIQSSGYIEDVEDWLEKGEIRVKYLDREDIESLGFKQGKLPYQYFSDLLRIIKLEKENLYSINANVDDHCLFYGTIKNKSELKKLLKQLGI